MRLSSSKTVGLSFFQLCALRLKLRNCRWGGTLGLALWSLIAMRRAEAAAESLTRK